MRYKFSILFILLAILISGCVKIGEFYVGLTMQPDMEDSPFEPGLNVYGVVKCGADFDSVNYYFEVQRMLDMLDWSAGMEVDDAKIHLHRITAQGVEFDYDLSYYDDSTYRNDSIKTLSGDRWTYRCAEDTFEVTSSCMVPNLPVIQNAQLTDNRVSFEVKADTSAYLYLVYVFQGENIHTEYKTPSINGNTEFLTDLEWEVSDEPIFVYVCAYDENLRKYQTTSNTFFKPNAFRPSFSTVDGGYGTFGAIAIQSVVLN